MYCFSYGSFRRRFFLGASAAEGRAGPKSSSLSDSLWSRFAPSAVGAASTSSWGRFVPCKGVVVSLEAMPSRGSCNALDEANVSVRMSRRELEEMAGPGARGARGGRAVPTGLKTKRRRGRRESRRRHGSQKVHRRRRMSNSDQVSAQLPPSPPAPERLLAACIHPTPVHPGLLVPILRASSFRGGELHSFSLRIGFFLRTKHCSLLRLLIPILTTPN